MSQELRRARHASQERTSPPLVSASSVCVSELVLEQVRVCVFSVCEKECFQCASEGVSERACVCEGGGGGLAKSSAVGRMHLTHGLSRQGPHHARRASQGHTPTRLVRGVAL